MKYFLIIILFFITLKGTKQKNNKIDLVKKNYKSFFTKIYSSNKIKASAIGGCASTGILFYFKKKEIISIKKTIIGIISSFFPLEFFLYRAFKETLEDKKEEEKKNQTPVKKKRIPTNQNPNKKSKISPSSSYHSEPERNLKKTSEGEVLFLSDFSSDSDSESDFIDQTFFKRNQTFLSEQESEKKTKRLFPFFTKNQKKSKDAEEEIDRKKIYNERIHKKERTFESFLSSLLKGKEQKIQIDDIATFPEKIKIAITNFLDLLEKQNKGAYLSIIKHSKERSDKTIIGNIITNIKRFLFQDALITDINIFNNIRLQKLLTIKKTTLNSNEIFICSRSSIDGKEKFEIIFSVNKTNSVNYIAILKITNSKKNNDLFESKQGYFYSGNNVFFENLTLHSIESFIVNEGSKQQSEIFLKELFLVKEPNIEFLRDIITLKFEEEKNKTISFLDKKFLEDNLNENKTFFWLGIPFNIEGKKANYI